MLTGQIVLITDSSGSASVDYSEAVDNDSDIYIINTDKTENIAEIIEKYEPDGILIYDNFDKDVKEICSEIRNKQSLCRPVIIVLTDKTSSEETSAIIRAGADDLQSTDDKEISFKLFAHLRRLAEESAHSVTKLPFGNTAYKMIKRNLEKQNEEAVSLMCIDIDNYADYKQSYGFIAAEKLLRTFAAIVKTVISKEDFFGQTCENSFIIITKPQNAEKTASFLSCSFDAVAAKFYSEKDAEKGYIILSGDDKPERRISFVSACIGIVSNGYGTFDNYRDALNLCRRSQMSARAKPGSTVKNNILILEKDAALSYLLSTTFKMKGYNVEMSDNLEDLVNNPDKTRPNLVILDITEENFTDELSVCKFIKDEYPDIKIIISTVIRDKERIFDAGADFYMPKPYELDTLFDRVENFLNEEKI